jgi:CubicO group peptidase (beta-lactamase class C family)
MRNKPDWRSALLTLVALASFAVAVPIRADQVDEIITAQMKKHHITGLSLAIIEGGAIVRQQGYGFTDRTHNTRVTTSTLFQAGSVSKPVSALGALHLVDSGQLSLDEDVNLKLRTWALPQNKFTRSRKVTLRLILSHSAGISVHGFPGYSPGQTIPRLTQVLNGEKPANSPAIQVKNIPGSHWEYSGGGYVVMQQMVEDVTGKPFAQFMDETVLKPLGMVSSTYSQPLPDDRAVRAAKGYSGFFGNAVKGGWHVYPELAPAGLWTTPGDLARFAIGIQRSVAGESNPVISQSLTRQMLTRQQNNSGLGLGLTSHGRALKFGHDGANDGFDAAMSALTFGGKGAVVMINRNGTLGAIGEIVGVIKRQYHWPDDEISKKESN